MSTFACARSSGLTVAEIRSTAWLCVIFTALVGVASTVLGQPASGSGELLGRPTDHSVTLSVVPDVGCDAFVEFMTDTSAAWSPTEPVRLAAAAPAQILLTGLEPDREYTYRLRRRPIGGNAFDTGQEHSFHTARPSGSSFTFAVEADPHLDSNTSPELYARSLQNALAYHPDFLVDLGDSFMSDKLAGNRDEVLARVLLLRSYYATVCHSLPLYLVLGNHEGEASWALDGTSENVAVWDTSFRKAYFPNPEPDGFYSGDGSEQPFVGTRESVFAWEWGDALFVVLDPYWFTTAKPGGSADNWVLTLGQSQYLWLRNVLTTSHARHKLVFIHNLVGGLDSSMRGGAEAAPFYEWGGKNADGSWGFDTRRAGWAEPIHQLLVSTGVNIVFHGHDHLYARQELDGVVYQEVPQPGWPGLTLQNPGRYGYVSGVLLPSSGHLRVTVAPAELKVEYVKAYLATDENATRHNGDIADSYAVQARPVPHTARRHIGRAP
jgi:hypothetical protein